MHLVDIPVPDSRTCRAAFETAAEHASPALLNHSVRAYLWAAAYAHARGMEPDHELLYVAAMFHDLGLVPQFDAHAVPFEEAGGHVARVFAAGAGWPPGRRTRLHEVVVRHMWPEVDPDLDLEGHLLELSTGLDVSGRGPGDWPAALRTEVLAAWPRLGLAEEFARCLAAQAERKPTSLAAGLVGRGALTAIATNALDR